MGEMRKTFTLGQLFTPDELAKAKGIAKTRYPVDRLETEVVKPALTRIDKATGQPNSPRYLAYLLYRHFSYRHLS